MSKNIDIKKDKSVENIENLPIYTPKVDIVEKGDDMIIYTEMAGVDKNSIDITIDNNTLKIEGKLEMGKYDNYQLVYSEFDDSIYKREFTISDKFDKEKIDADMKNGVLKITLPKAEEKKAKKIEVKFE